MWRKHKMQENLVDVLKSSVFVFDYLSVSMNIFTITPKLMLSS